MLIEPAAPGAGAVVGPAVVSLDKSKAWDKIDHKYLRLTNNVWGASTHEKLTSGVYLLQDEGFGWYWDRRQPQPRVGESFVKPIYPSVRIGGSPWDPSNAPQFPVKVSELESLKVDLSYGYPTTPTGNYNLAYDIFLSDTNVPSATPKPNAEVMVWLHNTIPEQRDTFRGDYSDGANTFALYSHVMEDGRLYYAFVRKEKCPLKTYQTSVDVKQLIDQLKLNPTWYIHGVELGNEVVDGAGKIEIDRFSVNINGVGL